MNKQVPLLQMKNITKAFPGVIANDKISLDVNSGEILALLGENGAGKSTLMKVLYGLHSPDEGEIFFRGKQIQISSPKVAVDLGIGMVHQHFMLIENMTALDNVMLGLPQDKPPLLNVQGTRNKFNQLVEKYGLVVNPDTPVWQLPVGKQQWLEILKLLFRDVQLLILDEPTAVLTPAEARQLFQTLNVLIEEGRSIIFISHKLDEVREIADRITVLRDGAVVGTVDKEETSLLQLSTMMVGRPVTLERKPRPEMNDKKTVLDIKGLRCLDDRGLKALKSIDLTLYSGEILGVAGVDGNGQRELSECITGLRQPNHGTIEIKGIPITEVVKDPSLLGFIPEDRHKTGLVLDFSIMENLILKTHSKPPFLQRGLIQWDQVQISSEKLVKEYDVRTPNVEIPVGMLSGGNQQKVVLARETCEQPSVIIGSQPTRGLDLGAVDALHELLLLERNRGAAVMFISTELSEVMALSDRIIVMFEGEIMGELDGESAELLQIGEMMMGHRFESSKTNERNFS
ncbi:MAG: ABC transporter ATP-binding protein [Ardenticatenaceae bacterium]|nr:ABC transporter ATP-binding protein [Ardenticatenaceae bacterium]MCB9443496.1 ABC transporter ATP-binding protein [Ardenticatenaceae bacterium]